MTSVEPRDRFVTHAEFRQFREHIDGQFSDIKMVLQGLAAGQTGVNWAAEQAKEKSFFDYSGAE